MTGASKSWREMREWQVDLLVRATGAGLDEWNARVRAEGPGEERALRTWLTGQGVTGYAQMLLVWERFGYPDFLLASADELIDAQYADRPALRPVLDAVLATVAGLGEVTVQARKTFVSLVTPRRQFAVVAATTRTRVDLGLRLPDRAPGGRLRPVRALGAATVRVELGTPGDVDDEVRELLGAAYTANC
jgi:Domain of unknown function (DUF5655)